MCTPSFMCKFPFSRRESLPQRDVHPRVGRTSGRTSADAGGPQPMANRPHHRTGLLEQLRLTIDCLPVSTREAMLEAVQSRERIIVGAYVDGQGGVCPMLAAHQSGGRTAFLPFAKAWDRFTRAGRRARLATGRELDILVGQLHASLLSETDIDLDRAIAEHRELLSSRERTSAADPSGEIVARRVRRGSRRARRGTRSPLTRPYSASPG